MRFAIDSQTLYRLLAPAVLCATECAEREYRDARRLTLQVANRVLHVSANNGYLTFTSAIALAQGSIDGIATVEAEEISNAIDSLPLGAHVEIGTTDETELVIQMLEDREQIQSVHRAATPVNIPPRDKLQYATFDVQVADFVKAARVAVVRDRQAHDPRYKYWLLRASRGSLRSLAGTGQRFVMFEKQGRDVVRAEGTRAICIPSCATELLLEVLGFFPTHCMTIGCIEDAGQFRTVFRMGSTEIWISDGHSARGWPDEAKFLDQVAAWRITVSGDSLACPLAGIAATQDLPETLSQPRQRVSLQLDAVRRTLALASSGRLRARRYISPLDMRVEDVAGTVEYVCPLPVLLSIRDLVGPHQNVQMELIEGTQQILVVRYAASAYVDDALWSRDERTMTRERLLMFLRIRRAGECGLSQASTVEPGE